MSLDLSNVPLRISRSPTQKAYYVGIHRYQYRSGEPAEILGIVMVKEKKEVRPCFHLRYADGEEGHAVMYDEDLTGKGQFYKIISEEDVRARRIPRVNR